MFGKLPQVIAGAAFALGFSTFGLLHAAPDPNFHIYIAYGQSNMGGTADAQSADKAEHPRFKIFATQKCSGKGRNTLGEVYPAVPSLFNCGNTISIADWFGRTMADSMPDSEGYDFSEDYEDVDPKTVGQFTGISDISGKEVYEDDIVRYRTGEDRITREPSFEILLINYSEPHCCFQAGNIYWENMRSENLEVIGNSHDNPELLSKGL